VSSSRGLLRVVLLARVITSLFVALMLAGAPSTFVGLGLPVIGFALGDGTLAIVMAWLALDTRLLRGKFVAAALLDGVVLLAAGATLLLRHGIPGLGFFLALYIGIAATCFSLIGIVHLLVTRRLYRRIGGRVLGFGLLLVGLTSAALGIATLFMPPNSPLAKGFLMFAVVLQGLALLLPAVNTWPASMPQRL
jgi:hypothetical protein